MRSEVGQTPGLLAAQHLDLELELLRVSVLPHLVQQPGQQHSNSGSNSSSSNNNNNNNNNNNTARLVGAGVYLRPSSVLFGMAYRSLSKTKFGRVEGNLQPGRHSAQAAPDQRREPGLLGGRSPGRGPAAEHQVPETGQCAPGMSTRHEHQV
ncbi:hypothetical protein EYF80_031115 [Liparis tanakae]|uniref:Uncharacterized protein n=1 Tax=Liparis tanakae TaxID=230148 RepID=A0A4Z2GZG2_9TELE|nr:hypothetical protein EYF80_031115 [Liparis tanakae]